MNIKVHKTQLRTIKQDDPRFRITDNLMTANRAGFEINSACPKEYKMIISECINNGWLKPVAYMTERELLISGLSND